MAGAVEGWFATPVLAWMKNVSQRKAPGAMRAIALLVSPVKPRVACICGAFCSAMSILLKFQFRFAVPVAAPRAWMIAASAVGRLCPGRSANFLLVL
jgi:hypothetical protein